MKVFGQIDIAETPWFEFRNGFYYERTYWGSLSLSEWPALDAAVQSPDRNKFASIVDDVLCKFDMLAPDRNPADCFLDSMPCIGVLPELCKCYAKDLVRPSNRLAIRVGTHTLIENQSLFHQMKELAVQLPNIHSSDFPWPEEANEEFRQKCVFNAKQIIAQTDFAQAIPAEVRTLLAPIHYSRLQIMKLLVDCPNARELLKSNPIWAIGLAIYSYDVSNLGCTRQYLKPLGNLSPIEIAELLGFPATDVVVRILAKVSPAWINSERLTLLIELTRDDGMLKVLEDVEVLSDLILDLLSIPTFKGRLTSNLLNEVLAESLPTWLFDAREHSKATFCDSNLEISAWAEHQLDELSLDPDELEVQRELASYEILHLMERIAKLEEQVVVLGSGFEATTKFHKLSLLKDYEAALEALLARHL